MKLKLYDKYFTYFPKLLQKRIKLNLKSGDLSIRTKTGSSFRHDLLHLVS